MKLAGIALMILLLMGATACIPQRQLKSPCVAGKHSGKNFAPCVRKPVNNVFLA